VQWGTETEDHLAAAPDPIRVYHFTHIRNLAGIIDGGLRSDAACRREGRTAVEIGSAGIRERRLHLAVGDVGPGGYVGDYVPWYFGPRSPMMFTLNRNNYEYQEGFDEVVYLASSVPRIVSLERAWIASDRNAALALAEFTDDVDALTDHISWDVIAARYWTDFADGADLRAAEFLVHESVPWEAVEAIVTKTKGTCERVKTMVAGRDHCPPVTVSREWYF
jgi:ssDNA thymidine ADP-ribosyltransferase, DarT